MKPQVLETAIKFVGAIDLHYRKHQGMLLRI